MCMCQQHKVQILVIDRQNSIYEQVLSLFHPEIHQSLLIPGFKQCAAAGYFVSCSVKSDFQSKTASFPQ